MTTEFPKELGEILESYNMQVIKSERVNGFILK